MSNVTTGGECRKQLVIYLMASEQTPELAAVAVESGADIIELGFPFSDPLADGPVIRQAAEAALAPALSSSNGLWLHGYWKFDWRDTFLRIASITPGKAGGAATYTRDPATPPQYPFTNGCRFYAVGVGCCHAVT